MLNGSFFFLLWNEPFPFFCRCNELRKHFSRLFRMMRKQIGFISFLSSFVLGISIMRSRFLFTFFLSCCCCCFLFGLSFSPSFLPPPIFPIRKLSSFLFLFVVLATNSPWLENRLTFSPFFSALFVGLAKTDMKSQNTSVNFWSPFSVLWI